MWSYDLDMWEFVVVGCTGNPRVKCHSRASGNPQRPLNLLNNLLETEDIPQEEIEVETELNVFIEPKCVAVIGASEKPGSLGRTPGLERS